MCDGKAAECGGEGEDAAWCAGGGGGEAGGEEGLNRDDTEKGCGAGATGVVSGDTPRVVMVGRDFVDTS